MGLFQLAHMSDVVANPQRSGTGRLWPELMWWPPLSPSQHFSSRYSPSLSFSPQFLHQLRATSSRLLVRASESTRWASLVHRWAARALRRWMLPTVERGPPGHAAFERRL